MTRVFGIWLFLSCALFGQTAPTAFTVASIKPNRSSDDRFMMRFLPGGGLTATGVTLKMLIMNAYEVAGYQIVGAPAWVGTERWNIEAKADGVRGTLKREESDAMLQRLLEDRFQLKSHRESKKLPAYALVVAKGGAKLKAHAAADGARPQESFGFGSAAGTGVPIPDLAFQLSQGLGRPVLDRTGLQGRYDFTLEWTPAPGEFTAAAIGLPPRAGPPRPVDPNRPSIFTALEEQLGLRLKSTKAPVEILTIDHVEQPSEN
jgi:bla regulator protein blaR1